MLSINNINVLKPISLKWIKLTYTENIILFLDPLYSPIFSQCLVPSAVVLRICFPGYAILHFYVVRFTVFELELSVNGHLYMSSGFCLFSNQSKKLC